MADNQKLIGEIILEDLKVEGIDKVLSLTMVQNLERIALFSME